MRKGNADERLMLLRDVLLHESMQNLVRRDRIVAHTHTAGIVGRIGDGRTGTANSKLKSRAGPFDVAQGKRLRATNYTGTQ